MNSTFNTLSIVQPLAAKEGGVPGVKLITSEKTGNSKITLMPKREFIALWEKDPRNASKAKKQATRDFEAYRVATLKELNSRAAMEIASGRIVIDSLNADKSGDLRTLRLVRRPQQEKDSAAEHLRRTSEITGISLEELEKRAKANGVKIETNADATVDTSATEVPSGDANAEVKGNLNEGAGRTAQNQNLPEAVAAQ